MFLLYGRCICTHSVDPSLTHFLGEFQGLRLALLPDVVVPEADQWCAKNRSLYPNFCLVGVEPYPGPWHLAAANVTTRLPRTPSFSRSLRHAGGYSGTILTPNPQTLKVWEPDGAKSARRNTLLRATVLLSCGLECICDLWLEGYIKIHSYCVASYVIVLYLHTYAQKKLLSSLRQQTPPWWQYKSVRLQGIAVSGHASIDSPVNTDANNKLLSILINQMTSLEPSSY